jgi:predicted dehydrogenase
VHAARRLLDREGPIEVLGRATAADSEGGAGVDQSIEWTMRFRNGTVAECAASYTKRMNKVRMAARDGFVELEPAFNYDGLKGHSSLGKIARDDTNQFVAQLDDLAMRIMSGVPPDMNSGHEALKDAKIIDAIYESVRSGRPVSLGAPVAGAEHVTTLQSRDAGA